MSRFSWINEGEMLLKLKKNMGIDDNTTLR